MAEMESFESLLASRKLLKTSIENSKALALALDKTKPKLAEVDQKLALLEDAIRPSPSKNCIFAAIRDRVNLALGPAVAVLKILDSIRELDKSLLSSAAAVAGQFSDLSSYISTLTQLEEALKFLTGNCNLAIQWLEGVLQFLEENSISDHRYILNVRRSIAILKELQGTRQEQSFLLRDAFDKLENSFKQILTQVTAAETPPFSRPNLQKLNAIVEKLNTSKRLESCVSTFVEIRSLNIRNSNLKSLDLDYFEKQVTEFDCIEEWSKHMELMVKHVLDHEHRLCKEVFGSIESSGVWNGCFAKIASESGILPLLQFGTRISESKKDPIKLLNLLHIFSVLDNLRLDFNKLFGGEDYTEIKTLTRDLVTQVVNGASEIFWELPAQVKLERKNSPPEDGGVPKLISFVTSYCNQLLDDNHRPILTQVLKISQGWKHEKYEERLFTDQIYSIVREMAVNLDAWSKAYDQRELSYLFMMNNHSHFHSLKGTKLGNLMGETWLNAHGQYKEYYSGLYLRESWGRLIQLACLRQDDNPVSKTSIKAFSEAIDDMCKKQSNWVILDESLREKMYRVVVQGLVPAYRSYLQKCSLWVQHNDSGASYYTVQSLESMLGALFMPKQLKIYPESTIGSHLSDKQTNAVTNQFRLTLAAM